jgi:hypothetical protein
LIKKYQEFAVSSTCFNRAACLSSGEPGERLSALPHQLQLSAALDIGKKKTWASPGQN